MRKTKSDILLDRVKQIASKDLGIINVLRLFRIFIKFKNDESQKYLKIFIQEYYSLDDEMPDSFYNLVFNKIHSDDYINFFHILTSRNIYLLISYLKDDQEMDLSGIITPLQYYTISKKNINRLVDALKYLSHKTDNTTLDELLKDELIWKLKINPNFTELEYYMIAYKIYLSIGLDNGLELLSQKYGAISYEQIHFLFSDLNIKDGICEAEKQVFNNFLFGNKKDINSTIYQLLNGDFKLLFLNFEYFYNNIGYFISKLGTKLSKSRVDSLLSERFLAHNISAPEITGDILDDMLSSYYNRYDMLDYPSSEIHKKNFELYDEYLRTKYKSSIPRITFSDTGLFSCEVLKLSDPRNLVLGYRAGNCFRINGDAAILFHNFLRTPHMRLLSISTDEHKDFAMLLIMRNGNVLIGQGIEVSKFASPNLKGERLYNACRKVLRDLMDYMNSMGDDIVATIIGNSNSNVSNYNNQILPFLINPILENSGNYYNGIYNYQCLLDLSDGKTLKDIKLYIPTIRYLDEREPILRRKRHEYKEKDDYMEIEKRLIALRFLRMKDNIDFKYYQMLANKSELCTSCGKDWYLTLFDDGSIDGFILEGDERAKEEYNRELDKFQHDSTNMSKRNKCKMLKNVL